MNRPQRPATKKGENVPRERGDEPQSQKTVTEQLSMFPASAGMNRIFP